jgi:SecD/SecF fusion protein
MAIRNGFDKATTTIVDANVTTLITAIVLYVIGTEQIKGFSVTLILGILMSMFTAIYVSRLFFDIAERKRWLTQLKMTRLLDRKNWNFLNKVSVTGVISAALIVVGIGSMFVLGPKILNHDLRGGSTVRMVFNDAQDVEKIRQELKDQNIVVNDEKIEFTVSGFRNDENPDRVFKVDSNLPAWEDGDGTEKFEQLDELLSRIFDGRLKLYHTEVDGASAEGASHQPQSPIQEMKWQAGPSVASLAKLTLSSSVMLLQDAGSDEPTQDENPAVGAQDGAQTDVQANGADADSPTDTQVDGDDPVEPAGGDFSAGVQVGGGANIAFVDVARSLTVDPAISGKTLRSLLIEASEEIDLGLDEDQIIVDSDDVAADESALTTLSKKWRVTMNVTREGDADKVISAWKAKFDTTPYFPTSSKVGGQIAKNTQYQALAAIIASLLGIIAYVWIRFQNVAFGLAAVAALIHDVLIVLGAIALSHWLAGALGILGIVEFKISLEIVAALLTVIGYSLNDTIVVFDRIREVRGKRTEITADMINTSISQTLSRTILTSLTTFIVVFILYCFGGEAIHGFAFALVVGVVVGTYSSIFIASPALLWLMNTVGLNPGIVDPAAD